MEASNKLRPQFPALFVSENFHLHSFVFMAEIWPYYTTDIVHCAHQNKPLTRQTNHGLHITGDGTYSDDRHCNVTDDDRELEHLKIPLGAIKMATNDFSLENLIGVGGFGRVYKGELSRSGDRIMVAIKRLDRERICDQKSNCTSLFGNILIDVYQILVAMLECLSFPWLSSHLRFHELQEISRFLAWHGFSSQYVDDEEDAGNDYISVVCWKSDSPTMLAANSQGTV